MLRALLAVVLLSGTALAGNGAPSGNHYNLNILGKDHCAGDDLTGSNRHTIQVLLNYADADGGVLYTELDRRNKIFLAQSFDGDFQVLDGNACDRDGARFLLPANPWTCPAEDPLCLSSDGDFQAYEVYARAPGKAGGSANMTTCGIGAGEDGILGTTDDETVCSTENVVLVRDGRNQKFDNVTKELTTLCLDTDDVVGCDTRIGIFADDLYDYYWDYDNYGLRIAQLRFYPKPR